MSIFLGSGENLDDLTIGRLQIDFVRYGNELVWRNNTVPEITPDISEFDVAAQKSYMVDFSVTEMDDDDSISSLTVSFEDPDRFADVDYPAAVGLTDFDGSFTIPATLFTEGTNTDQVFTVTAEDINGGVSTETITVTGVNKIEGTSLSAFGVNGGGQNMTITQGGPGIPSNPSGPSWISFNPVSLNANDTTTTVIVSAQSRAGVCGSRSGVITLAKGNAFADPNNQFVDTIGVSQNGETGSISDIPDQTFDFEADDLDIPVTYSVSTGTTTLSFVSGTDFVQNITLEASRITGDIPENTGISSRAGTYRVSNLCATEEFTITQNGAGDSIVAPNVHESSHTGGNESQIWTVSTGPTNITAANITGEPSWASVVSANNTSAQWSFSSNVNGCARSDTSVVVRKGTATDTFTVSQAQHAPSLSYSTTTLNLGGSNGDSFTFTANGTASGCGSAVSNPCTCESTQTWLSCVPNSDCSSYVLSADAQAEGTDARSATITLELNSPGNTNPTISRIVNQSGKEMLETYACSDLTITPITPIIQSQTLTASNFTITGTGNPTISSSWSGMASNALVPTTVSGIDVNVPDGYSNSGGTISCSSGVYTPVSSLVTKTTSTTPGNVYCLTGGGQCRIFAEIVVTFSAAVSSAFTMTLRDKDSNSYLGFQTGPNAMAGGNTGSNSIGAQVINVPAGATSVTINTYLQTGNWTNWAAPTGIGVNSGNWAMTSSNPAILESDDTFLTDFPFFLVNLGFTTVSTLPSSDS